jgi:hypothetical protein
MNLDLLWFFSGEFFIINSIKQELETVIFVKKTL